MSALNAPRGVIVLFSTMARRDAQDTAPNGLRNLRKKCGWTLKDAGEKIGTTAAQVQRLESGERELTLAWMQRCGRVYDVPPADCLLPSDGGLSEDERALVDLLRLAPASTLPAVVALIRAQLEIPAAA